MWKIDMHEDIKYLAKDGVKKIMFLTIYHTMYKPSFSVIFLRPVLALTIGYKSNFA